VPFFAICRLSLACTGHTPFQNIGEGFYGGSEPSIPRTYCAHERCALFSVIRPLHGRSKQMP
jgi:hypothetical protein